MVIIKKANAGEIDDILQLIDKYSKKGMLLEQTRSSLLRNLSSTYVALINGEVVGTASLYELSKDLVEIRSLAVNGEKAQKGIGTKLVRYLIEETRRLQISQVMATTDQKSFFEKCGFELISADQVTEKLNKDCYHCEAFSHCRKMFMIMEVSQKKADNGKRESIYIG